MSQRIAILPEIITNKIAAGEVVERPASVIKELVENALDAGATDITVEIAAGGRRLIRVSDNGYGMSREDALLCLERHATSKIRNDQDLAGIATLGFRGEALPSIASVSRFTLATRERDSVEGTEIIVEGGRVRDVRACGRAPGTTVTVEQIFFNTPARLKFLKSAETEAAHAGDAVTRMAVSRPEVSFLFISDGRELLRAPRGDLMRRLSQAAGRDAAGCYPLEYAGEEISISGYIAGPAAVRSTTGAMFTFINGRFVRDRVVQHAVMQAYRGVTDRGRYPVLALFLSLPPGEVDVNVHPTKHEVRFRRQTLVHDTLQQAVASLLAASPWLKGTAHQPLPEQQPAQQEVSQAYRERIAAAAQRSLSLPPRPAAPFSAAPVAAACDTAPPAVHERSEPFAEEQEAARDGYFSTLSIIGQFHGEYILCQSGADLVVIDQHAASERVAYQRLRGQYACGGVESQRLLFPETLELSFSEVECAVRNRELLNGLGFELEPFGGSTLMVAAVPRLTAEAGRLSLVRDMLAELEGVGSAGAFGEAVDELLARLACHSVVRGVYPLERQQISELLKRMDETGFAASCPHGRPVSHVITLAELEKIFKRT